MAPAQPKTVWRRTIVRQLSKSSLPISNEMAYRNYVSIIFDIAQKSNLGTDLRKIGREPFFYAIRKWLESNAAQPWEIDMMWYAASLLMDYSEDLISPPFQGASMICGCCGLPAKINETGDRYVCPYCHAQSAAGPNRIPIGIPASSEIRKERERLHQRLVPIMGSGKLDSQYRNKYYNRLSSLLGKPRAIVHIGNVTTLSEVAIWDAAINQLENGYMLPEELKRGVKW